MARKPDIDKTASEVKKLLESIGDASLLETLSKETLVKAINEVKGESSYASVEVAHKANREEVVSHTSNDDIHVTSEFKRVISDSDIINL